MFCHCCGPCGLYNLLSLFPSLTYLMPVVLFITSYLKHEYCVYCVFLSKIHTVVMINTLICTKLLCGLCNMYVFVTNLNSFFQTNQEEKILHPIMIFLIDVLMMLLCMILFPDTLYGTNLDV